MALCVVRLARFGPPLLPLLTLAHDTRLAALPTFRTASTCSYTARSNTHFYFQVVHDVPRCLRQLSSAQPLHRASVHNETTNH